MADKQNGEAPKADATETKEPEAPKDPFANIPVITLNEASVRDLSGQETSAARKYSKVAEAAAETKMPVMIGWKHERAIFVPGTNRQERKGSSVHGTIQSVVAAAGRSGITAYDLAAEVRVRQIGNKRSHYCEKLPPVGWAEGWINSAVTRGIISVHATRKAPALRADQTAAKDTEATKEQDAAAKRTGTTG